MLSKPMFQVTNKRGLGRQSDRKNSKGGKPKPRSLKVVKKRGGVVVKAKGKRATGVAVKTGSGLSITKQKPFKNQHKLAQGRGKTGTALTTGSGISIKLAKKSISNKKGKQQTARKNAPAFRPRGGFRGKR